MNSLRSRAVPAQVRPPRFDEQPEIDVPVTMKPRVSPTLLALPYPPPVNTLYGHRVIRVKGKPRAVPYKTDEHRTYCDRIATHVGILAVPWPKETQLAVTLRLFRPRKAGDIDGPLKTLLDSLNGRAWVDDSQIVELHVIRGDDKSMPRVEVSISVKEQGAPRECRVRAELHIQPKEQVR